MELLTRGISFSVWKKIFQIFGSHYQRYLKVEKKHMPSLEQYDGGINDNTPNEIASFPSAPSPRWAQKNQFGIPKSKIRFRSVSKTPNKVENYSSNARLSRRDKCRIKVERCFQGIRDGHQRTAAFPKDDGASDAHF